MQSCGRSYILLPVRLLHYFNSDDWILKALVRLGLQPSGDTKMSIIRASCNEVSEPIQTPQFDKWVESSTVRVIIAASKEEGKRDTPGTQYMCSRRCFRLMCLPSLRLVSLWGAPSDYKI